MSDTSTPPKPTADERVGKGVGAYLAVSILWVFASSMGFLGSIGGYVFYFAAAAGTAAFVIGLLRNRPKPAWPWILLLGALVLAAAGSAARTHYQTLGNLTSTRSVVPDLITLPVYVLLGIGLLALVRQRSRKLVTDDLLDGLIAALAGMVAAWAFLVAPTLSHDHAPFLVKILLTCYPAASIFLGTIALHHTYGGGVWSTSISGRMVLGTFASLLVGDAAYMMVELGVITPDAGVLDGPYALGYIFLGGSVLHHSVKNSQIPVSDTGATPISRLAIVAGALLLPAIVTFASRDSTLGDQVVLGVLILLLTLVAVLRVYRSMRSQAQAQETLTRQATHDHLTGLPNRAYVEDFLHDTLGHANTKGSPLAVMFLDLDRFKYVNDTLGHAAGDELIIELGERIRKSTPTNALVGRLGGDEFVIVLPDTVVMDAAKVAERIRLSVKDPFKVAHTEVATTATLGISYTLGNETVTGEDLIRDADTALYHAKDGGKDTYAIFDSVMRNKIAEQVSLEGALRGALEREEISVAYQPIIDNATGDVHGFEALMRWHHTERGFISPAAFIPAAEESGLIIPIGSWILKTACKTVARWRSETGANLHVSVNVSVRQFNEPAFLTIVNEALAESGLPAHALDLEITESILMDPNSSAKIIEALRSLGVTVSVDDFGTGYSSLSYLRVLPVDRVKIDRSFVEDVTSVEGRDKGLAAAIVAMAKALGMTTVAEGVETPEQDEVIKNLGCTYTQGYYYSRPETETAIGRYLSERGTHWVPQG